MERVDVMTVRAGVRKAWRNGGEWDESAMKVLVGEIADGRWYVRRYGGGVTDERVARAYSGLNAERYARKTAARWMRTVGGTWVETEKL